MNGHTAALIEMTFGFGVVLAWAFWELWSLRRSQRRDAAASAERARHTERQHGADEGGPKTP